METRRYEMQWPKRSSIAEATAERLVNQDASRPARRADRDLGLYGHDGCLWTLLWSRLVRRLGFFGACGLCRAARGPSSVRGLLRPVMGSVLLSLPCDHPIPGQDRFVPAWPGNCV